ncbi:MAG: DUF6622 family protein, partial [Cellvibrio sp.]
MNYLLRRLFYILTLFIFSLSALGDGAQFRVTKTVIDLGELPTGRPAKISLWFPEGHCSGSQQPCLAESAVTDRTLVLSHGAMGAAENYHWLAEPLAAAGYIVVGVNHYGESWFYGAETQDRLATSMMWQRPTDISAIYDALSNRELFQRKINWSNIIALGHSSGGQTLATLAGAQYDLLAMMDFCKTDAAVNDHSCDYGIRNAPKPGETFVQKFGGIYKDSRVKKIIMIDPTLGYGATPESLAKINLPTLVVGAQQNDFLPWDNHGARYTKYIPYAKSHLLTGREGHFIFIDSCNSDLLVMGVSLCHDRVGVDRVATQAGLVPVILEFVREDNITIDAPKQFTERKKAIFDLGKISQILIYTPRWVFGLLAGLVILGLMQVRTRHVHVKAAFIMPVAMTLMSVIGALMDLGFNWITILSWLVGAISVTVLIVKFAVKSIATYDPSTRRLTLSGSWIPLIIIMAIFSTRYALGMSIGMKLAIVQ